MLCPVIFFGGGGFRRFLLLYGVVGDIGPFDNKFELGDRGSGLIAPKALCLPNPGVEDNYMPYETLAYGVLSSSKDGCSFKGT